HGALERRPERARVKDVSGFVVDGGYRRVLAIRARDKRAKGRLDRTTSHSLPILNCDESCSLSCDPINRATSPSRAWFWWSCSLRRIRRWARPPHCVAASLEIVGSRRVRFSSLAPAYRDNTLVTSRPSVSAGVVSLVVPLLLVNSNALVDMQLVGAWPG